MIVYNGFVYFTATNGTDGVELWRTDGTSVGTICSRTSTPARQFGPSAFHDIERRIVLCRPRRVTRH